MTRWRVLIALGLAELLAMALWFSGVAIIPAIADAWSLDAGEQAWLTMSVQLGFVIGALGSALLNLADRYDATRIFVVCAIAGAACNAAIILEPDLWITLLLRGLTGVFLAGVYPTGMKIMASWFTGGRGFAIGLLVAALTVGSASPHLFNVVTLGASEVLPWKAALGLASASAVLGAAICAAFVRTGPGLPKATRFHWRHAMVVATDPPVRLANLGYLGHQWELYAMWAWAPLFLLQAYEAAGWSTAAAGIAGFAIVGVGGISCIAAGVLADRIGRTTVAIACLAMSGSCALVAGFLFDFPLALTCVCLVWGFFIIPDSAQFSTAITELCDPRYVGAALTMQTCLGFLLTMATIRLVPLLAEHVGWGLAFASLALGPAVGMAAMARLRCRVEAGRMAAGKK